MTVQTYARIAGLLFLLSIIGGGIGEAWVPAKLVVSGNAAATADNLRHFGTLFRVGFAAYLVEALCDVALAWIFYVLLRPVQKDVALLAAFFGLVSTALFGFAELFYFSSSLVTNDAALAMLFLRIYGLGAGIFMAFYGVASLLRGILIFRSGYLPKFLGVLLALAGVCFIAKNFLLVLAPAYASDVLLLPAFLAVVALAAWLLAKGVDLRKWEELTAPR